MRFMIMVKEGETQSGPPTSEQIAAMGRYNEELIKAGVMLAGEGLIPSKFGPKVKFGKKDRKVTDGPFSETKELIGGFWIIEVKDKAECMAWVDKIPFYDGEEVEIRRVSEVSDFVHDEISTPWLEKEQEFRDKQKPIGS
jgi:hypothetical protein